MRVNYTKLGAAMLGTSPVLVTMIPNKVGWWIGTAFTILGPFVMCLQSGEPKQNQKQEVEHEDQNTDQ